MDHTHGIELPCNTVITIKFIGEKYQIKHIQET